ncbi:MAG TPA: amidohydrolase family protein [Pseudonocardiaceae bacterium]|nr:amidohydrolase family protein [Pseudonocardiaceae bacterium]
MNLDELVAIDVHVHVEVSDDGHLALPPRLVEAASKHFGADNVKPTVAEIAAYYRELHMACVIFTVDAESATGHPPISNTEIARAAAHHPDVLIPFASLDPARGATAVREATRLVKEEGVRGFKFHPSLQGFAPSDQANYPLYEAIQAAGVPALFHSGQTGIGAGVRGGGGIRLKYGNPMELDDLAVDFPDLTIIIAHPSFPWQDEALAVAGHKPNVYIDLSGWSPKYFPPQLVRYANSLLQDKVLFGSDHPLLTPQRWLRDFDTLDIKPAVRPKILKDNAIRALRLTDGSQAHA